MKQQNQKQKLEIGKAEMRRALVFVSAFCFLLSAFPQFVFSEVYLPVEPGFYRARVL